MLKILQSRLQQYMNWELPDVQAGFRKGRGTRDQTANNRWIIDKQENYQKTSTFALLTTPKPLTVWITTNCGKFLNRWEYQTILPASWKTCMLVEKQHGMMDYFQTGKRVHHGCILYPAYITYMQSTSCKMLGWMKHKLESRLQGEISITSDTQKTPPFQQKVKRN